MCAMAWYKYHNISQILFLDEYLISYQLFWDPLRIFTKSLEVMPDATYHQILPTSPAMLLVSIPVNSPTLP